MLTVKALGVLLISVCPSVVTIVIYLNMIRRINQLKCVNKTLLKIRQALEIKSFKIPNGNQCLNQLTKEEYQLYCSFLSECSQSSSDMLMGSCEHLILFFKQQLSTAESDFSKHGKITLSAGVCIGIVIFILAI